MTWAATGMSRKTCSWVRFLSPGQDTQLCLIPGIIAADPCGTNPDIQTSAIRWTITIKADCWHHPDQRAPHPAVPTASLSTLLVRGGLAFRTTTRSWLKGYATQCSARQGYLTELCLMEDGGRKQLRGSTGRADS